MPEPSPPFQLVKGDKYNLTLGVLAAFVLATAKDQAWLPTFWRWQLNAYTNWNLTFLALRVAAGQEQWDPFLLTNSMGVWLGFRTAFCQGLDENMRKKIAGMGLPMPRPLFLLADHLVHTAPPLVLLAALVHRRQRVPKINAVYALVLSTWFAFRQNARLDASDIYVPHPWKRAWVSILIALATTPPLVDALIARSKSRTALCAALLIGPWLSARLDPNLRQKYNFEASLARARTAKEAEERRQGGRDRGRGNNRAGRGGSGMPRVFSAQPLLSNGASP